MARQASNASSRGDATSDSESWTESATTPRTRTSYAFTRRGANAPKRSPQAIYPLRMGLKRTPGAQTAPTTARTTAGSAAGQQGPRASPAARSTAPPQPLSAETFNVLIRRTERTESPATTTAGNQRSLTNTPRAPQRTPASRAVDQLTSQLARSSLRCHENDGQENRPPPGWVQPPRRAFLALEGLGESSDPNTFGDQSVTRAAGLPAFFQ